MLIINSQEKDMNDESEVSRKDLLRDPDRIVVNYAIHTHPMTQLKSPDLLDNQKNSLFEITCQIMYAALPLIVCFELTILPGVINAFIVGNHEGSDKMAAVGLGTVLANIFGFMIIQNLGVGFSVICSYFDDKQEVGFMYQKTLGINFFICIIITPLLYLSDHLLILIGFDPTIVEHSTGYVWALVPSFYLFSFYDTTRNYLQSQKVIYPPLVVGTIGTLIHYFLADYFVVGLSLGITGAAWAKNISDFFNALALYLYIVKYEPTKESWIEWNIISTNNLHKFLLEILTHEAFTYFEALAFQVLCIIACHLSQPAQIAAHFAFSNSLIIFYIMVMGVSHCLNRTISLSIEDDDVRIAKKKVFMGISFVLAFSVILSLNLISLKQRFFLLFHDDLQTSAAMRQTLPIFITILILESVQIILFGILKTLQIQNLWKIPAKAHYIVGLGSALIFAYLLDWNLQGIWLGWLLGIITSLLIEIRILRRLDWEDRFFQVREKYRVIQQNVRSSRMEMSSYGHAH